MDIDLVLASQILKRAYQEKDDYDLLAKDQLQIQFYVSEMGITYGYIFITGLLAKATNEKLNPICLQAGASLPGAYDARSLCHKVVVPNTEVNSLLGSSNEPFLNKPARIPSLDKQVAFKSDSLRKGVHDMIVFFKTIDSSLAYESLKYALSYLSSIKASENESIEELLATLDEDASYKNQQVTLLNFYKKVLDISCEGESLILCVQTALINHYKNDGRIQVIPHPSNESGASSKEVEDIDILFDGAPFCCVELKDKLYDVADVSKSVEKVVAAKATSLLFVEGPNARFIGKQDKLDRLVVTASKIGVNVQILSSTDLLRCLVTLSPNIKPPFVIEEGVQVSKDIRAKKKTLDNWTTAARLLIKKHS